MNQTDLEARQALKPFSTAIGWPVRFRLAGGPFKRLRGALLNGCCWLLGKYLVLRRLV